MYDRVSLGEYGYNIGVSGHRRGMEFSVRITAKGLRSSATKNMNARGSVTVWLVVIGCILLVALGIYLARSWGTGSSATAEKLREAERGLSQMQRDLAESEKEREAIRQQAAALRAKYDAAIKRAQKAEEAEAAAYKIAQELQGKIGQLDAARKAQVPVKSVDEGYRELLKNGFKGK